MLGLSDPPSLSSAPFRSFQISSDLCSSPRRPSPSPPPPLGLRSVRKPTSRCFASAAEGFFFQGSFGLLLLAIVLALLQFFGFKDVLRKPPRWKRSRQELSVQCASSSFFSSPTYLVIWVSSARSKVDKIMGSPCTIPAAPVYSFCPNQPRIVLKSESDVAPIAAPPFERWT